MYYQLLPPSELTSLVNLHFGIFKRPKSQNACFPPSQPRSLGYTHFRTFKAPNSKNVYCQQLSPSEPKSLPDRLGVRILGLSSVQNPKTCTSSCSPHQSPNRSPLESPDRLLGSTHFGTFKGPELQKVYSQLLPPSQLRSLGNTQFGTSKSQNVYFHLLSPSKPKSLPSSKPRSLGSTHFGTFTGPKIPKCVFLSPSCLHVLQSHVVCSTSTDQLHKLKYMFRICREQPNPSHYEKQPVVVGKHARVAAPYWLIAHSGTSCSKWQLGPDDPSAPPRH